MEAREYQQIVNKQQRLPKQYARALQRVRDIEAEMRRYGLEDILNNPEHVNRAWDREVEIARAMNTEPRQ
jgi:DNA-binding ferritin-like protein (Dps family)